MKQTKLWLTTIAALLCSLTASAHDFEVDGIYYNITSSTDLTVEVTYQGSSSYEYEDEYSGAVTIPSIVTYNGITYSVTSIGKYAFYDCSSLTSITLPENVTSIGSRSFEGCSSLTSITLPEGVTSIGSSAFRGCSSLTSITLPESVTSIGNSAFSGCSSLTSITIPESVTSIGDYTFDGCSRLTSIPIPEGVTSIGSYAFRDCSSLTSITFPEGVTSIGERAFFGCSSLTSITLPEGVTSIGDYTFDGCSSFTSITLPEGVTSIGSSAFRGCSSLTSITLPEGVTSIGNSAFNDCSNLTSIILPEGVTSIGEDTFRGCSSLTSIILPDGVTSIAFGAFEGCRSLTSITIPESVTSIGDYAFYNCISLYKVINCSNLSLSTGSSDYGRVAYYAKQVINGSELTIIDDFQFRTSNDVHYLVNYVGQETDVVLPNDYNGVNYGIDVYAFSGCSSLTSITIPESVTSIGQDAFSGCSGELTVNCNIPSASNYNQGAFYKSKFTKVTIGDNVTSVGSYAFYYCSSLTSITIPENSQLASIGIYAFRGCSSLTSITLPENSQLTSIGSEAFSGCSSLTSITIPDGVTSIRNYAFYGCSSLTSIIISDGSQLTSIGSEAFSGCSSLASITIPDGVTSIGSNAFSGCSSLTSITISDGSQLTSIGNEAFSGCSSLASITIPEGVASIGSKAFYGCSSLTSITISDGSQLTSIGNEAFSGCSSLASITIPEGVTSIGSKAFFGCGSFTDITVDEDNTVYDSRGGCNAIIKTSSNTLITGCASTIIPESVTSIEDGAFSGCRCLTSIILPAGVMSIEDYAFYGCSSLTSIILPEGSQLASIGDWAFSGCSSLTSITIPKGVTSIGGNAFYGCSSLRSITIPEGVTSIGNVPFWYCNSLTSITVDEDNTVYDSRGGCNAIIETSSNTLIKGCAATIIPEGVTSIGEYAFSYCSSLTSITIPEGVTNIGNYAFYNCDNLYSVTIGSGVQSIGSTAFSTPDKVIWLTNTPPIGYANANGNINYVANGQYTSLSNTKVYPYLSSMFEVDGVKYVPVSSSEHTCHAIDCAYDSTAAVINVGETASFKGVAMKVTEVMPYAFYGNEHIKEVSVSHMGNIGDYAFSGCISLDAFSFGSNMESIGAEAFSDCINLTAITSHAAVPPTCGTQALNDIDKQNCVLRVPSGYAAAYQAADQWKEFLFVEDVVEVDKYVLTYVVDGEVYHTDTLVYKAVIVQPETPVKEGYTFSGWSEIPATMPAEDITISGTFTINKYLVTFKIGDEVIAADSLEYGATIVAPEAPEKEGYTFDGWGEVVETVPANDVTIEGSYSVNSYQLTYTVDGETVQTDSVAYGTAITLLDEPIKEGHTFSGWSEAPEAMPASDVIISGTFTVNKYLVTFKIDDEVIAADSLEYGATIVAPEAPEREGHTFNGWGEVVETVPASDVTIEGSYSVNFYLLSYMVDGEIVQSDSVAYGTVITLLDEPTKEGYTFSGWSEAPDTMPAEDVTISGMFTVNIYKVYYYVGEELIHTAEVPYGEAIPEYIYEPTKEDEIFEGWIGETYATMPAHDVTYVANITNDVLQLIIDNIDNSQLTIYDLMGRKVTDTENLKGGVYIINGRKVVIGD